MKYRIITQTRNTKTVNKVLTDSGSSIVGLLKMRKMKTIAEEENTLKKSKFC